MNAKREGNLGLTVGVNVGRFSLVLAALVLAAAFVSPASAGVQWVTKQVGWASNQPGAARALSTGGLDTLNTIGDEADSNRTIVISTTDWAWHGFLPGAATSASNPGAIITVTGQRSNAAAESLYAIPEKCFRGGCARSVLAAGTWSALNLVALTPFGMTGPTWGTWSAGSTATVPYTLSSAPTVLYQGRLPVDTDEAGTNSNCFGTPEFRLNVIGDIGGTTPSVTTCRVFITYPKYVP